MALIDELAAFGAIPANDRVVRDRNRLSGGGVTAGIDFGLTLAAELAGEQVAKSIQLMIEYDPQPPFDAGAVDKVGILADGSADFAKAVGLDIDLSGGGLGLRSKRYSMVVKDGVVTQLNVEATPGTADTSGAETLLGQI